MTLRVWWAKEAELLPWNVLQDRAPVIRLDDLREVVEGLEKIVGLAHSGAMLGGDIAYTNCLIVDVTARNLLAQLKGVPE